MEILFLVENLLSMSSGMLEDAVCLKPEYKEWCTDNVINNYVVIII